MGVSTMYELISDKIVRGVVEQIIRRIDNLELDVLRVAGLRDPLNREQEMQAIKHQLDQTMNVVGKLADFYERIVKDKTETTVSDAELKDAWVKSNMSQADLGTKLYLSQSAISRLLSNETKDDRLRYRCYVACLERIIENEKKGIYTMPELESGYWAENSEELVKRK